ILVQRKRDFAGSVRDDDVPTEFVAECGGDAGAEHRLSRRLEAATECQLEPAVAREPEVLEIFLRRAENAKTAMGVPERKRYRPGDSRSRGEVAIGIPAHVLCCIGDSNHREQ